MRVEDLVRGLVRAEREIDEIFNSIRLMAI